MTAIDRPAGAVADRERIASPAALPATWRPWLVYTVAVLTTPVLHGLCFPPASWHLLAWIAFVPWFVAIRIAGPLAAQALTCAITLAGTYFVAGWLPRAVSHYYGQPAVVGIVLFVSVWAVTIAPWVILFTACYRALAKRYVVLLPLVAAAAWTATEVGRVRLLVVDPFGLFGYSQVDVPALVQIADLTGVYGITFIIIAINTAFAELLLPSPVRAANGEGPGKGSKATALALSLSSLALVAAYGFLRLNSPLPTAATPTRIAIIQPNLDLGSQWRPELYGETLREQMLMTLQAQRDTKPALVFWPENAMTFFIETEPTFQRSIASGLERAATQLIAGGPHVVVEDGTTRYFNSAFLIAPNGSIAGRYDKRQLLPFAEYFPFATIGLLRREFGKVREFTPGDATAPLQTVAGPAGIVICNETMFPEIVSERIAAGSGYLVVLSNDSWLGDAQFSAEVFDMARLRAIEQRRYLVRASTSGPSAIVDPFGRVQTISKLFDRDIVSGTIASSSEVTFYGRYGDVFAVGCGLLTVGALGKKKLSPN